MRVPHQAPQRPRPCRCRVQSALKQRTKIKKWTMMDGFALFYLYEFPVWSLLGQLVFMLTHNNSRIYRTLIIPHVTMQPTNHGKFCFFLLICWTNRTNLVVYVKDGVALSILVHVLWVRMKREVQKWTAKTILMEKQSCNELSEEHLSYIVSRGFYITDGRATWNWSWIPGSTAITAAVRRPVTGTSVFRWSYDLAISNPSARITEWSPYFAKTDWKTPLFPTHMIGIPYSFNITAGKNHC